MTRSNSGLSKHGLKLNMGKCVGIQMNSRADFKCPNGQPLKRQFDTTYLGVELNEDKHINMEIENNMNEVRRTWIKLNN